MAIPIAAAAPLALAAAGVSAVGSIASGIAARNAGNATAAAAEAAAKSQRDAAEANAQRERANTRSLLGRQAAMYAREGLDITSGSPLDVMADSAAAGELTAQGILAQGVNQANLTQHQGQVAKAQGRAALIGGVLGAGGSLLGGAAQAARYGGLS